MNHRIIHSNDSFKGHFKSFIQILLNIKAAVGKSGRLIRLLNFECLQLLLIIKY